MDKWRLTARVEVGGAADRAGIDDQSAIGKTDGPWCMRVPAQDDGEIQSDRPQLDFVQVARNQTIAMPAVIQPVLVIVVWTCVAKEDVAHPGDEGQRPYPVEVMRLQVVDDPVFPKSHLAARSIIKHPVMVATDRQQIEFKQPIGGGHSVEGTGQAIPQIHDMGNASSRDVIEHSFQGGDVPVNVADDCQSHRRLISQFPEDGTASLA